MTIQVSTPKPFDRDTRGGLSQNAPDCITCKLPKETVSSVLKNTIGYRHHHAEIEYLLKDLNLVTVPLVAWRNQSGQFLGIDDNQSGTLGFSDGDQHNNDVIPRSEQLFLFVPHL
ncbi:14409_t:CDS:2, partial [Funneliformis geosporum]